MGEPPLDWVGADVVDGVVEELGAVDGLVEEGAESGVGCGGSCEVAGKGNWTSHFYLRRTRRGRVRGEFDDNVILVEGRGLRQLRSCRCYCGLIEEIERRARSCGDFRGPGELIVGFDRGGVPRRETCGFAIFDGYFFDGAEEVFGGGVGEAIALEPGAHGLVHGVAADDAFKGGEGGGGFAVGDAAVGVVVAEEPGEASDGVEVGDAEVAEALIVAVAEVGPGTIEGRGVAAEDGGEDFDLGVGVDALV